MSTTWWFPGWHNGHIMQAFCLAIQCEGNQSIVVSGIECSTNLQIPEPIGQPVQPTLWKANLQKVLVSESIRCVCRMCWRLSRVTKKCQECMVNNKTLQSSQESYSYSWPGLGVNTKIILLVQTNFYCKFCKWPPLNTLLEWELAAYWLRWFRICV